MADRKKAVSQTGMYEMSIESRKESMLVGYRPGRFWHEVGVRIFRPLPHESCIVCL